MDKAAFTLKGLLSGIAADHVLTAAEVAEIENWMRENKDLIKHETFREIGNVLAKAMADGLIEIEEQEEILWVCRNFDPTGVYYNDVTHEMQYLHGTMHGILSDGIVSEEEARHLYDWIENHSELKAPTHLMKSRACSLLF
jgi:hypothetical protein